MTLIAAAHLRYGDQVTDRPSGGRWLRAHQMAPATVTGIYPYPGGIEISFRCRRSTEGFDRHVCVDPLTATPGELFEVSRP